MQRLSTRVSLFLVSLVAVIVLFPATAYAATFPVVIDSTTFPDETWREYVNARYAGGDYELTEEEALAVSYINVNRLGITDLTGIEYFSNITSLACGQNNLTELDLTGLSNLIELDCVDNFLTELDLTSHTELKRLDCGYNQIAKLDLTALSSLERLLCVGNYLTKLNVTGLTNLQEIICENNNLVELDVTGLTSLESLYCGDNSLVSLKVTGLSNLVDLYCSYNSLTSLDLSGLTSLEDLVCASNLLTSLDVTGLDNLGYLSNYDSSLLEIVGLPIRDTLILKVYDQTRTIPMISDGQGGYISSSSYPVATTSSFVGLDEGVTYDTSTGKFHANIVPGSSEFITLLQDGYHEMYGTLMFTRAYAVTFVDWDGTLLGSDAVNSGDAAIAPTDPEREGYSFMGWDIDFSYVTTDLEVTALYELSLPVGDSDTDSDSDVDSNADADSDADSDSDADAGSGSDSAAGSDTAATSSSKPVNSAKTAQGIALARTADVASVVPFVTLLIVSAMSLVFVSFRKKIER